MSRLLEHVLFLVSAVSAAILTVLALPSPASGCTLLFTGIAISMLVLISVDSIISMVDELRLRRRTIHKNQACQRARQKKGYSCQ